MTAALRLPVEVQEHREQARDIAPAVRVHVHVVKGTWRVRGEQEDLRHAHLWGTAGAVVSRCMLRGCWWGERRVGTPHLLHLGQRC